MNTDDELSLNAYTYSYTDRVRREGNAVGRVRLSVFTLAF